MREGEWRAVFKIAALRGGDDVGAEAGACGGDVVLFDLLGGDEGQDGGDDGEGLETHGDCGIGVGVCGDGVGVCGNCVGRWLSW